MLAFCGTLMLLFSGKEYIISAVQYVYYLLMYLFVSSLGQSLLGFILVLPYALKKIREGKSFKKKDAQRELDQFLLEVRK